MNHHAKIVAQFVGKTLAMAMFGGAVLLLAFALFFMAAAGALCAAHVLVPDGIHVSVGLGTLQVGGCVDAKVAGDVRHSCEAVVCQKALVEPCKTPACKCK